MPLDQFNARSSMAYRGNQNPVCPWCDAVFDIAENEYWELYEEDDHEIHCGSCEKAFVVSSRATWCFDTDEQDEQYDCC